MTKKLHKYSRATDEKIMSQISDIMKLMTKEFGWYDLLERNRQFELAIDYCSYKERMRSGQIKEIRYGFQIFGPIITLLVGLLLGRLL